MASFHPLRKEHHPHDLEPIARIGRRDTKSSLLNYFAHDVTRIRGVLNASFPIPVWRVIVRGIPHNNPTSADQPETLNEPVPVASSSDIAEGEFVRLYEQNVDFLVGVATHKFQVPSVDAEALAHEVFLSYLKRKGEIREVHKWLIGAICHASRYYWRKQGRNTEQLDTELANARPDPGSANIRELLPIRIAAGEALAGLPVRYQHILRLRYIEGYTIKEIAEHLGVTSKYTQKLVTKCLRRAEQLFAPEPGKKK